jgi:hypothetical protein
VQQPAGREGLTSSQISGRLNLSRRTVDGVVKRLKLRFSANTRAQVLVRAGVLGLIPEMEAGLLGQEPANRSKQEEK